MRIIEASFAIFILFSFIIFLNFYKIEVKENEVFIKSKISNILALNDLEIRRFIFLNETEKIREFLKKYLEGYEVYVCKENRSLEINTTRNIISFSYFYSTNFSHYENLELLIYVWKI